MDSIAVVNKNDLPFILSDCGNAQEKLFENGDGFDIYCDGARYLPDNVTISRVHVQIIDNGSILKEGSVICDMTGTIYSPFYNLRQEFRGESVSSTAVLQFRIDSIDPIKNAYRLVGVCAFNIFTERGGKVPTESVQEFCLNEGAFQLPLMIPKDSTNLNTMVRLPCSTLLIRIRRAPRSADMLRVLSTSAENPPPKQEWEKLGLLVPAPLYSSGLYDSTRANPTSFENKLYNKRKSRQDILVTDIIPRILRFNETIEMIRSREAMADYVKSRLNLPEEISIKDMVWIDPTRISKFQPDLGFRVSIDFAVNLDSNAFPFCIYSLSPPASFYADFPLPDDVLFTSLFV